MLVRDAAPLILPAASPPNAPNKDKSPGVQLLPSPLHTTIGNTNPFLHNKMATQEGARKIIEEIAGEYGYLDREMMDDIGQFNADYRRRIDENWLKMENAASHSIKV